MKNSRRFGVVAVAILFALSVVATTTAANGVTVGNFLHQIAKLNHMSATNGEEAANQLRAAGINLPTLDARKALTEGDVAAISQSFGLNVTTSSPEADFDQGQMDGFMSSFASSLNVNVDNELPGGGDDTLNPMGDKPKTDPLTKGKGKKKGLNRSPSEPL